MNDDQLRDDMDASDPRVRVTVLHGGFDRARYAVMVPVYVDEEMSGAERFLDGQFGQLLSAWQDLGRYPDQLGTSVFVEPDKDVKECEPPGAYLVGVGSSLDLDRRRLKFAVRRALIDRCLRLYPPVVPDFARGETTDSVEWKMVGVSSALLGVRDDESLRVEDSVAGILEAVDDTNADLADFEDQRELTCRVRIGHVEFIERYADRANLAASAIRHISAAGDLASRFRRLGEARVKSGDVDGALPIGANMLEHDRPWRRFLIAERQTDDPSSAKGAPGSLVVEVSALGREARSDRVTHRIDRASLDALVTKVSSNRANEHALRALRDRLVPYALRTEFLTTAAIQLVVDASTANYPWELLVGPALSQEDRKPAGTTSVLRMFTEGTGHRLNVDRGQVGRALVIGAGHVDLEGLGPLPEAVQEAKDVKELLEGRQFKDPVLKTDAPGKPLDVADLNIALTGSYQVLHLACHGIHLDGDRDATGAVLTKNLRFTEDLVESLPNVPELVVLNSCYNATIGPRLGDPGTSLAPSGSPREAAGLARALMGIGVRAVVAAGWPVDDRAAHEFAIALYTALTDGRSFGEAVAAARLAAAERGGSSWAAYQCYGDPTFVLRGRPPVSTLAGAPVSVSDLKARLGALRTRAADISRPKPGGPSDRRERLTSTFDELCAWVETEYPKGRPDLLDREWASTVPGKVWAAKIPPEVRREIALTARELADFETAANWYRTFAVEPGGGQLAGPAGPQATAHDLQEAANCLARSVHDETDLHSFPEAVLLAKGANNMLSEGDGYSILASVHKKWATIEPNPTLRRRHLRDAGAAYQKLRDRKPGAYGVENEIQVLAVRDIPGAKVLNDAVRGATRVAIGELAPPVPDTPSVIDASAGNATLSERADGGDGDPSPAGDAGHTSEKELIDAAPQSGEDYWARARAGDCELTRLMIAESPREMRAAAARMVHHYADAFRRRSTYSERFSSWDHLTDLYAVLPDGDPRKGLLRDARDRLGAEDVIGVPPGADPAGAEGPTTAPESVAGKASARESGPASVQLTAYHAGPGDCLLLEYTGDDEAPHRILIDGGLGSAFDSGLARALPPVGNVTDVDVAVVTHVDRDHLEGVLKALQAGTLVAKDFWFNGRGQIAGQLDGPRTRSTRQGDALSTLIPDASRNAVVEGRALIVPESGPKPLDLPGGASAVLLSPSEDRLRRLLDKWPVTRGDASIEELMEALADEPTRGPGEFGKDQSVTNGSSIAFLFEHDGVAILFTADAFASELESSIERLLMERGETKLKVQLFKLSHHGSRQNLTTKLLSLIEPEQVLICTDGSQFEHPDEDALALVHQQYPSALIHFTDSSEVIKKRAAHLGLQAPSSFPVTIELRPSGSRNP